MSNQLFYLNNEEYSIPDSMVDGFLRDNPDAVRGTREETIKYSFGGEEYSIPKSIESQFLLDNPGASKIGAGEDIIHFNNIETEEERSERNSRQMPQLRKSDLMYKEAGFWGRLWDSFGRNLVPWSSQISELEPPDESSELWAEAIGGFAGSLPGFIASSAVTGGMGIPLKGASAVKKAHKFTKYWNQAQRLQKIGKTGQASKKFAQATKFAEKNKPVFEKALIRGELPISQGGILGSSNYYQQFILAAAKKNPKLARSLNLFSNNLLTFNIHGQVFGPLDRTLEERIDTMKDSSLAAVYFSVAGMPRMMGWEKAGIKYAVEPGLLMGAGMFSDFHPIKGELGDHEMSLEERAIHGITLLAFHYSRQGLNKVGIKDKINVGLKRSLPGLTDKISKKISESSSVDKLIEHVDKSISKHHPELRTYSDKKNPDRKVEFLRVRKPTKDDSNWRAEYVELSTGRHMSDVRGSSRENAQSNFLKKFKRDKSAVERGKDRVVAKDLTDVEKSQVKRSSNANRILLKAIRGDRSYSIVESKTDAVWKNPFEKESPAFISLMAGKSRINVLNRQLKDKTNRMTENPPKSKSSATRLSNEIAKLREEISNTNRQIRDDSIKVRSEKKARPNFVAVPSYWKVGDYFKIPFFNEAKQAFDYTKAGLGKFVGKLKDMKGENVIMPEWARGEKSVQDLPVFEIRSKDGASVSYVLLGGEIPQQLKGKIEHSKRDRPLVRYEQSSPEYKNINDNPIVSVERKLTGDVVEWNPNSPLFKNLFVELKGKNFEKAQSEGRESVNVGGRIFHSRSKSSLKKSLDKDIFKDGLNPESALKYQSKRVESIERDFSRQRDRAREDFRKFQGADESQWNNMNNMSESAKIGKPVMDRYPELDPLNERPYTVVLKYKTGEAGKERTIKSKVAVDGVIPSFKTKSEAAKWSDKHWVNSNAIEAQISMNRSKIESIRGPAYAKWSSLRNKVKSGAKKAGMTEGEYRSFLKDFFPGSKGSTKNMTERELGSAAFSLSETSRTNVGKSILSNRVQPPDSIGFVTGKIRKMWNSFKKYVLPDETVLMSLDSPSAHLLARLKLNHTLAQQEIAGAFSDFKENTRSKYNLTDSQMRDLSTILEKQFKDWAPKELEKMSLAEKENIIRDWNEFTQMVVAEILIPSGVMVRIGDKVGGPREKMFEAYDSKGNPIELADGLDAIRMVSGFEFRSSGGDWAIPEGARTKKTKTGFTESYLKTLRIKDPVTGRYSDGWYIIGKEKFVPQWKGGKLVGIRKIGAKSADLKDGRQSVKLYNRDGKSGFNHHIVDGLYLPRIVTNKFRELVSGDKSFREALAWHISETDPQFLKMKGDPIQKKEAAYRYLLQVEDAMVGKSGVFGEQWVRTANLSPVIVLEAKTGEIINLKRYLDIDGNPVSKGSEIVDIHGKSRRVGKVIDVYERNFEKIVVDYGQRIAHIAPTYKFFGARGAESKKSNEIISKIATETDGKVAGWAKESLQIKLNAMGEHSWFEKAGGELTAFTAQIGLSSPFSGYKNFILGQASNSTVFGFRLALKGMYDSMANPEYWTRVTRKIGGTEAGVHELASGRIAYTKYNPGMMKQTEIMNRIVSTAIGETALKTHIDNLSGVKNPMNRGVSEKTSWRTMSKVFKFTDAEISEMIKLGSKKIYSKPEYITRAQQMSHLITQGGPTLPFVPYWMGRAWAKPLTLFYRVAYRMTENVVNSVMRPAIFEGNPVPMIRYIATMGISGELLYSTYYWVLGDEVRDRYKNARQEFWMNFIRAEGIGVFSNAFDEYGGAIESYTPVTLRVLTTTAQEILAVGSGDKFIDQGVEDLLRKNVVAVNHAMKIWEKHNAPLNKRVKNSKRRQMQFANEYLNDESPKFNQYHLLTDRSKYYRVVRESFFSDDAEGKAKAYYSARNYIMMDMLKDEPALIKSPHKVMKKAKKILKGIYGDLRPIPESWSKSDEGRRPPLKVYLSLLTEEELQEEKDLNRIYKKKMVELRRAINKYRKQHDLKPWLPPSRGR